MIRARHIPLFVAFFRRYSSRMLHKHFHKLEIELDEIREDRSVLLIANHFSWWDGFIGNYLNHRYFKKTFHVMMLEEQLENRMFLNKAGAYSIQKASRSLLESLHYTAELLDAPENLVMLFPQGHFESLSHQGIRFEKGLRKILEYGHQAPQIVFNINLVDYFEHPSPSLYIRTRLYQGPQDLEALETAFNLFHMECIEKQNLLHQ